jgi:hypothetical protein
MHLLNAAQEDAFRRRFIGRTLPVLWETHEPYGFGLQWSGLTGNYLRVVTHTNPAVNLRNQVINTHLLETAPAALLGQLPSTFGDFPAGVRFELIPTQSLSSQVTPELTA